MSKKKLKLGSLFDGIGGFPLVGSWYDIEPVWASEIEAAPIRITKEHFPNMKHLGDITKIHGDEIEPVDILTGGSPCQDLSVAGKQSGIKMQCEECGTLVDFKETENSKLCPNCGAELTFTRSGLFMEQMRIIREMREKTNECYPKIVIWENVSGALSSNNGDDFFCVLQEFCKLMAERIPTFRPENWSNAGEILGKSGSIAWRLFDAQYWGVPQRRRRIFLVADFTGQHAGEILFKSESLRRHLTPSTVPWKILTSKAEESIGNSSRNQSRTESITESYGFDGYNSDITGDISATLGTNCGASSGRNGIVEESESVCLTTGGGKPGQGFGCVLIEESDETNEKPYVAAFAHQQGGKMPSLPYSEEVSPTLLSSQTMAVVIENHGQDCRWQEAKNNVCPTLAANMGMGGNNTPLVLENPPEIAEDSKESAVPYAESGFATYGEGDVGTLRASGGHYGGGSETLILSDKPITLKPDNCMGTAEDKAITLMARDYKDPQIVLDAPTTMTRDSFTSISVDKANTLMAEEYRCQQIVIKPKSVVRRLTPLECERLQGFPDSWTASESDAARYKALGNSVALPCVNYVMSGIADVLDAE